MLKTYDIILDVENELYSPSNLLFEVSRNDLNTIQLNLIIQQDGAAFDLTQTSVELAIKKPSGLTVYQETEIVDDPGGKARTLLSLQAYIEYGIYKAEVYVRTGDQLIVTCPFWYAAREAIMENEAVDSVNDWSALQQALLKYDKKPVLTDGLPAIAPEYVGQIAFDTTGKRAFIANGLTVDNWQLISAEAGGAVVAWVDILNKPATFPPSAHSHMTTDIIDFPDMTAYLLETDADAKYLTAIPAEYLTQAEGDALYQPLGITGGTGGAATWGSITGSLADQTDLQTTLDSKLELGDLIWTNITGKPATFPPSAHTHLWADITDKPTTFPGDWATVANKPATFPPSAHTHLWADITDKPASFPSDWATVANKPASFPPSAHTHAIGEVTGLQAALDAKADDTDLTTKANVADVYTKADVYNKGETYNKTEVDQMTLSGGGGGTVIVEDNLASTSATNALSANQGRILQNSKAPTVHTHLWADITDKPTTFAPSAHTHAWGDITGTPASFPSSWADVANKPATFTPAAHTHLWADITDKPTTFASDWATVANKPASFPPSAHTHLWADITDKPTTFASDWANVANKPTTFAPPLMSGSVIGGAQVGNGLAMSGNFLFAKTGASLGINSTTNAIQVQDQNGTAITFWRGTQAAYDAITTKDANTLYFISG